MDGANVYANGTTNGQTIRVVNITTAGLRTHPETAYLVRLPELLGWEMGNTLQVFAFGYPGSVDREIGGYSPCGRQATGETQEVKLQIENCKLKTADSRCGGQIPKLSFCKFHFAILVLPPKARSFIPKRDHRIHFHRAPRWHQTGCQSHSCQNYRNCGKGRNVRGAHAIKQRRHQSGQRYCGSKTRPDPNAHKPHSAANHELQHVTATRAQRHADSDFVCTLSDR